jgi:transposase
MLMMPAAVRIFLWTEAVDMRKGFDSLTALVRAAGQNIFSGHLFVPVSRRAERCKILAWQQGGMVLWYKRLARGTFRVSVRGTGSSVVTLDAGQLAMLLDGVDYLQVKRAKRWEPYQRAA